MRKKGAVAIAMMLAIAMTGCGSSDNKDDKKSENNSVSESVNATESGAVNSVTHSSDELFSDRDYENTYDESKSAVINLNGTSATCASDAVDINGGTITIKDEGTYILRGTLDDGMVIVNAGEDDKTQLVLDNVDINCNESAPIYVLEGDKVFITLAEGSVNSLKNGGTFTAMDGNDIDSVIFSKSDITLNGTGSLDISSPVGHGIVSKDELTVTGGVYDITCSSSGLNANDNICIDGGTFSISSGKDGVHCEHSEDATLGFVYIESATFDVTSEGDGISASGSVEINDGTFTILAGGGSENGTAHSSDSWGDMPGGGMGPGGGGMGPGGDGMGPGGDGMGPGGHGMRSGNLEGLASEDIDENESQSEESTSMKGIKSEGALCINGGIFDIDSADDGVHSNTSINVTGGSFNIATGDDGFHADADLCISGGTVCVSESYEGLEGLDIVISGGEISLIASDDGINAAGGTDSSGFGGRDDGGFGKGNNGHGGMNSGTGGSILITGGNIDIQASGDGIDSNGTLKITGGTTTVCGPTNGDTAVLDYESTGTIEGGTFIGTGAYMMALSLDSDTQGVLPVSVGQQFAGSEIVVTDSAGKEVLRHTPELEYQIFIVSSPDIIKGEMYTINVGDVSGEIQAE